MIDGDPVGAVEAINAALVEAAPVGAVVEVDRMFAVGAPVLLPSGTTGTCSTLV